MCLAIQCLDTYAIFNLDDIIDFNVPDVDGKTPFILACDYGYVNTVKILLQYSKYININATDISKNTALHWACKNPHNENEDFEISKLIFNHSISKNIDLNAKDYNNETILQIACEKGENEVVKMIFEHPKSETIDLEIYDTVERSTALHSLMIYCNKSDTLQLIFDKISRREINFNKQNTYGNTIVHYACLRDTSEALKLILDHRSSKSIDLSIVNDRGRTALHCLCKSGLTNGVKMLLKHPSSRTINMDIKDECGESALDIAHEKGLTNIIELLNEYKSTRKKPKLA